MKLGIVGLGVIGRAVRDCAECETVGADKGDPLEPLMWCDAIAVCVGTPALPSGACDTSALDEVLTALCEYQGPIVTHCTAPATIYAKHQRPNVVYVPEFVRGDHAAEEYKAQRRIIIGGDPTTAKIVFRLWREWLCPDLEDYTGMPLVSAAMAKYVANALLATKVALLNEVKPLAEAVGADWDQITDALADDPRLGHTHWQVPGPDGKLGFGGACFPKDMKALVAQGAAADCAQSILAAVLRSNDAIRGEQ